MTVSMRVMSAGDGYKYLLRTVAAADGDRTLSTPLTRYYVEAGTPPGQWLGSGVASLGKGQLAVGDRVSEAQLQLLMGMGRDPITGDPLGLAFPAYKSVPERIEAQIAELTTYERDYRRKLKDFISGQLKDLDTQESVAPEASAKH